MSRLSRREQRLCACLLTMILSISGTGAWLTWRVLQDEQVQLQGDSAAQNAVAGDHSLETDLTKAEVPSSTKHSSPGPKAGAASGGRQGSGPAAPSLRLSRPTTIDGSVVAAVITVGLLVAAAVAARFVIARYRREHVQSPAVDEADRHLLDGPDVVDEQPDEIDDHANAASQDEPLSQPSQEPSPADGLQQSSPAEPAALRLAGIESPAEPHAAGSLFAQQATAPYEAESLLDPAPVPAPRSSTLDARQEAPVGFGSTLQGPASPLPERTSFATPAHDATNENIFDRRAARRVPYVQSAWLWWGETNGPVMVQDISTTGLRLRFPGPGPTQAPQLGQSLRIFFPVSGTTVKVNGRVQWKRTVDGGAETGLQFVDLTAVDQELIQAVVLEAE